MTLPLFVSEGPGVKTFKAEMSRIERLRLCSQEATDSLPRSQQVLGLLVELVMSLLTTIHWCCHCICYVTCRTEKQSRAPWIVHIPEQPADPDLELMWSSIIMEKGQALLAQQPVLDLSSTIEKWILLLPCPTWPIPQPCIPMGGFNKPHISCTDSIWFLSSLGNLCCRESDRVAFPERHEQTSLHQISASMTDQRKDSLKSSLVNQQFIGAT